MDFKRLVAFHDEHCADVTLFTHPNSHPYDSAVIRTDSLGRVIEWLHKEDKRVFYKNRVNAGIHVISSRVLDQIDSPGKWDLDRDLLKPLVTSGQVYAYDSPEYVRDMGTPDRLIAVEHDVISGKVKKRNLNHKQKAVFLDRDGTLNVYKGFITDPNQIELIDGVSDAIRRINESEYLAIIVSNQPVIARGDCTWEELDDINNCLETRLGENGAYVDGIFICPHHPDKGFPGERPEYKTECSCRKPKPGLILEAADRFNIDIHNSYMVGDSMNDVYAGLNAGCKAVLIGNDTEGNQNDGDYITFNNLLDFVQATIG